MRHNRPVYHNPGLRHQRGLPAEMNHPAWTKGRAVIQIEGEDPFVFTYVDPADDPLKQP
jgi:hypothetical protein